MFVASDKSHRKIGDIYTTLALLRMEMQFTGYMPMFDGAEILCSWAQDFITDVNWEALKMHATEAKIRQLIFANKLVFPRKDKNIL